MLWDDADGLADAAPAYAQTLARVVDTVAVDVHAEASHELGNAGKAGLQGGDKALEEKNRMAGG